MKQRFINKIYKFYELSILPPQNITLLELKRKEFKEKSKYLLDLKTLYNLTNEEKNNLRSQGYFVDLSEETIKDIKNFKLSYNRHEGRYLIGNRYYNFDIFNDKYYLDQYYLNYEGDPEHISKLYRARVRVKKMLLYCLIFFLVANINYHIASYMVVYARRLNNSIFEISIKNGLDVFKQ